MTLLTDPAPKLQIQRVSTVSRPEWKYCAWPTLIRRANGELVAVYCGGRTHHVCPFGQIHIIRSNDGGESWSEPLVIADGPLDNRGAGVAEAADGTLIVKFFTTAGWQCLLADFDAGEPTMVSEAEQTHWRAYDHVLDDDTVRRGLGCWCIRSTDDGKTWSPPIRTPVLNAHGPTLLDDGRLIYPGKIGLENEIGLNRSPFPATLRFGIAASDDAGKTWQLTSEINPPEGGKFTEPHAVQAADGRIVMHIRYEAAPTDDQPAGEEQRIAKLKKRFTYQTQSFDGGRTWETPVKTSIWGFPNHLLRLTDDRLLVTYGHRLDPVGSMVRISNDHGQTWSDAYILHHDPKTTTDIGYPSTVQLDETTMLSMWYERPKGSIQAELKTARWRLDQLNAPTQS